MRYLATATMAASVLAIGLKIDPAVSFSPGGKVTGPDTVVQKVQQQEKGMGQGQGPGAGSPGQGGGKGGPAAREPGGGGAMRDGGGMRQGGGGMRSDGGGQFRSERGMRGDRDRDRDRRRFGRRDGGFGLYFGPSYGYVPGSCNWLRRRALETGSPYWWRRYRACRGGY